MLARKKLDVGPRMLYIFSLDERSPETPGKT
jgi:hypothetical protein